MHREIWLETERRLRGWKEGWCWAMHALLLAVWMVPSLSFEAKAEAADGAVPATREAGERGSVDAGLGRIGRETLGPEMGAEQIPASIEAMRRKGAEVVELGAAEGLRGFLVRQPGGGTYAAYVTPSGAVVVGLLYGADGEVVTERQLAEAREAGRLAGVAPAPGPAGGSAGRDAPGRDAAPQSRVAGLVEATRAASGFWMGSQGPVIHVFADPTCPFSERHVNALKRDAAAGRLRAHVIPVGILGERAALRAVEIAGADEARIAWEGGFGGLVDRGLGAARIEANNALLDRWRVNGVPFSVWTGPGGVRVHYGAGEAAAYAGDVVGGG